MQPLRLTRNLPSAALPRLLAAAVSFSQVMGAAQDKVHLLQKEACPKFNQLRSLSTVFLPLCHVLCAEQLRVAWEVLYLRVRHQQPSRLCWLQLVRMRLLRAQEAFLLQNIEQAGRVRLTASLLSSTNSSNSWRLRYNRRVPPLRV